MSIYTPYTYLVKHKPTGRLYYGVRFQRGCHPDDFFVKYFTSSNRVKFLLEEDGIDAFEWEIRQTFTDKHKAIRWESRVLKRMKVIESDNLWLNKSDSEMFICSHTPESKEKLRRFNMGKKLSPEHKAKIAASRRGQKLTREHREKLSAMKRGQPGRPCSEETKEKLRAMKKGKKLGPQSEEIRKKRGAALKGIPRTPEWLERMSESMKLVHATKRKEREANGVISLG